MEGALPLLLYKCGEVFDVPFKQEFPPMRAQKVSRWTINIAVHGLFALIARKKK